MSRWQDEFDQHSFQAEWNALIKETADLKADDETVLTTVEELVRLQKVILYVDLLIKAIDVELVPQSIWDSFALQVTPCLQQIKEYQANRAIKHLISANKNADNLLSYVKPYMAISADVLSALDGAASTYRSSLESYAKSFVQSVQSNLSQADEKSKNVTELLSDSKSASESPRESWRLIG